MNNEKPNYKPDAFSGLIGVSQLDITPPAGIYFRNWGAGNQQDSKGIHRPLKLTAVSFRSTKKTKPLLILAADFGVWANTEDGKKIRHAILEALELNPEDCMFNLSHTHAAPILSRDELSKPGGILIEPYLLEIQEKAIRAARQSINAAVPAVLTWNYGKSSLASNRDLPDEKNKRYVVGYNPAARADDTLLVGRITDEENRIFGTIINYACHPTTLAWDNQLISPDFVGAMRNLVESATQAPCLFLQGASGELAPREQYSGDTKMADKNGDILGYSVLATLESMLPPKKMLTLDEVVESGAPLAVWKQRPFHPSVAIVSELIDITYQLKSLPSLTQIEQQYNECTDDVIKERIWRQRAVRMSLGDGDTIEIPCWIWKLGDSFLIGQPNEAYSDFQIQVRSHVFPRAAVVMNLVNGSAGYLPPRSLYQKNIYQVWQTPFAAGSLEQLIQKTKQGIDKIISTL